jgi:hypothetical protein
MGISETHSPQAGYRLLMAAIIARALDDLRVRFVKLPNIQSKRDSFMDQAMAFFHSQDFESYCDTKARERRK